MRAAGAESRSLAPTALVVAGVLAVGSLVPILRDALVASRLGASVDGDAYFLSTYLSLMLVTIFVSESATPAAVVTLSGATTPETEGSRGWQLPAILALAGAGLGLLAVVVALLAHPLAGLLVPGFGDEGRTIAADSLVATAPVIVLLGLTWLVAAWLNARGSFVVPALITPLVAVGACLPLLAGTRSPTAAAFGWTIGAALALTVLLLAARFHGPMRGVRLDRARLRVAGALAMPLLLLTVITQSTEIADRVIASHVGPGALTTVSLAKKTIILPSTILVAAVGAVVLPFLSRRSDSEERSDAFGRTLNLCLFFLLPTAAFLVLLRTDVVRVLYGRGQFGPRDVGTTAGLLGMYAVALVPTNIGVVLQRSFAALGGAGSTRTPLYPYAVAMGCYIPAAWFGSQAFGLKALPLAFAAAEFAYVAALIIALDRRLRFALPALLWPAAVAAIATLGACAAIGLIMLADIGQVWLSLGLKLAAGATVYAVLVAWLGHPAASDILATLSRREDSGDEAGRLRVGLDVTYAGTRDGTGRYGSSLARELALRDDIDLLPVRAPRVERLPRPLRLPINGIVHMLWVQAVLPVWAWRRRVDVLHITATGPFHAPCPVVVTIHDGLDFYPALRPSSAWSAYVRLLGVRAARRADGIITISESSASEISRFYDIPRKRIRVIWHGSELPKPSAEGPHIQQPFVLMVASATRRKNFETALAAVELVREQGFGVEFVVVGSIPGEVQARVPWLRVFSGIDDATLARMYRDAAAVIVPSRHEGFGLPAVEALALGTPVIASDIPALREITLSGVRFSPPEDPAAFAAELITVLSDPCAERDRIAPVVRMAASLTWARSAEQTAGVYRHVLLSTTRGHAWISTAAS